MFSKSFFSIKFIDFFDKMLTFCNFIQIKLYYNHNYIRGGLRMVQGTHENIINAIFRIASKNPEKDRISLTEVANEINITRQAIYAKHFSCTNDIFEEIHNIIDEHIFNNFCEALQNNNGESIYSIIAETLIPSIYKHRHWLKILYTTSIDPNWRTFLRSRYVKITMTISDKTENNGPLNTEKFINIMCEYIMAIFANWISDDFPTPPSVFKKEFLLIMNTSPIKLINIK